MLMKCKCGDSMIHAGRLKDPYREFLQCLGATERVPFTEGYKCDERWQVEISGNKVTWRSKGYGKTN